MTDLTTTHLKHLLDQATPGPWTVEDDGYDIIVGNAEGHRMGWGDQVRFKFEAGDKKHDTALAAHAPELAEEVIRLREQSEGLSTPNMPEPKFDENGLWKEREEEPEIFVLAGGVPKRFVGIGFFSSDENQIMIQARPVEEMRELAYVLLAAANHQEKNN